MRYSEILSTIVETHLVEASPKKPQFGEEKYGTWVIKYRSESKDGKYDAVGMHPRNPNLVRGSSEVQLVAITMVKDEIDRLSKNDNTVLKFTKGKININSDFSREFLTSGPTGVRLQRKGSDSILILCSEEYADAFQKDVYGTAEDQFSKLYVRKGISDELSGHSALYGADISIKKIQELGLQPNGRYALAYLNTDPEYGHLYFKLVFDSITASSHDKLRMNVPGLTLAVS